jgi:DNA-binding protein HU-beta
MNKHELIASVAEKTEETKKLSEKMIEAVLVSIEEALARGEKVQLMGFGTWESKPRKGREGRNPQTGETIQIEPKMVPVFKCGKLLKDAVEGLPYVEPIKKKKGE